ncbi:hypothetical protein EDD86DRAFT_245818 [Gorgonomyces haynaldii]|nr:hypothetical protein EDD86DRAFT_245818 [Gorgonomyces haynaldii]
MSIQVTLDNKETILNAIKSVRNDASQTNWALVGHLDENPNILTLEATGEDGFEGLVSRFAADKVQYALFKFVYVHSVGENVGFAKRGRFGVVHGSVLPYFQPYHLIDAKVQDAAGSANHVHDISYLAGKQEYGIAAQAKKQGSLTALNAPSSQPNLQSSGKSLSKEALGKPNVGVVATQSHGIILSPDLVDAIKDLRNDKSETTWVVGSIAKPVGLVAKGTGGVSQFVQYLVPDKFVYILTRVTDIIDGHKTVKFVFVSWIGNNVSMMSKAKVSTFKGGLIDKFSPYHVDLTISETREISDQIIADKVASASGSRSNVK